MGSPLRLTLVLARTAEPDIATRAWSAVSAEFDSVDAALSRHRPDAELVALNRSSGTGESVRVSERLYRAVVAAERAWRLTGGVFDPRVAVDLDRLGQRDVIRVPTSSTGDSASRPSRRWLERMPRARRLTLAEPIDLGGIGKGLALRWAWRRMVAVLATAVSPTSRTSGTSQEPSGPNALLEAGGDLIAAGRAPDGGPWLVGIEDPCGGEGPLAVLRANGSVCTSSTRLRRWQDGSGRLVHHLIDPRTGQPGGAGLLAVTVAAADPAWGEVWTKALFLAGASGIAAQARRGRLAAWWVDDDGRLTMTQAAAAQTVWAMDGFQVID